jgi:hypothetical protein
MSKRSDPSISRTGQASRGGPKTGCPKATADIGVVGALSIGIGGIIGGGFFATFGLAVVSARGLRRTKPIASQERARTSSLSWEWLWRLLAEPAWSF